MSPRSVAAVATSVAVLALSACARDSAPVRTVLGLTGVDTLVTEESELLGAPADLALDAGGQVYVLDQMLSRIVRLRDGEPPVILGRYGEGPGEFASPTALSVRSDTMRVADVGNGRVQVLSPEGVYVRSYVFPEGVNGPLDLGRNGETAVATLGMSRRALVTLVDTEGHVQASVGDLVVPAVTGWDFAEIKAQIRKGNVPRVLRNTALPVLRDDGTLWIVLLAEGVVRSYDRTGTLQWARPIESPEVRRIKGDFLERNRKEENPSAFHPLSYAADAVSVGEEIWLLLWTPEEDPSAVLVFSADGRVRERLVLPTVTGARDLAVDRERNALYLTVPSSGSLVAVPLPERPQSGGRATGAL